MTMDWIIPLSFYLSGALAFNIDPVAWKYVSKPAAAGFGYKVVQNSPERLLISAPLEEYTQNRRGQVYQCLVRDSSCKPLSIQVPSHGINMSLGLSMTMNPESLNTMVCGPTIPRECKTITTYNGMCFEIYPILNVRQPVPSSLEECPGQTDIAFLLDGSGSVDGSDFVKMKTFVKDLIREFLGRDTKFAVAQYSTDCTIHFDLKTFDVMNWDDQVNRIRQQRGWTFTAASIQKVVQDVFSTSKGSRPKAKKILIVITDGESNDSEMLGKAASEAEAKNIIRFAIGVGGAFSKPSARNELQTIASSPPINHVFQVGSFQALGQIKNTLQNSIFPIEGSQTTGESIQMEMAQEGFSAAYVPAGGFQMGSVGAFQWRGAYQEYTGSTLNPTPQQSLNMEPDSYMGYSIAVARTQSRQFTILGAPRFKHTGRVVVLPSKDTDKPIEFSGQIGAYFGAEVCAMDVNKDSYSDLVLISAPMFTDRDREGRVYVCTISDRSGVACQLVAEMTLVGDAGQMGRFGTSLAPLPDLNMDGFNDLAVGAPLENDGQGSVYIFHGTRSGISKIKSQRISASDVQPGLKYFGLSISQTSLDMSSDSLPDLAVGSNGAVLLLRSRPIVTLTAQVSFNPAKIPTIQSDCSTPLRNSAEVCFTMTRQTTDTKDLQAKINYTLTLDVTRQAPNYRAYIGPKIREETKTITLRLQKQCFSHNFFIEACPEDSLNELSNELDFTFEGLPTTSLGGLSPILSPQSPTTTYHPLGFEINCGADNNCIDNLKVDFNFTRSSEVRVGIDEVINVTVSVESREENSYNSHVILTYPAGLSFRKFIILQGRVECNSSDSDGNVMWGQSDCTIDKPIFKSNSKALFVISYGIDRNTKFGQMMEFTANASSGNTHSRESELFKVKEIGVKYSIYVVIKRNEDSTSYVNFTAGKNDLQKHVKQSFEVENYERGFNITVIIKVPVKLGDKDIWADPKGIQIQGCQRHKDEEPTATEFVDRLQKNHAVDCSVAKCGVFMCKSFIRNLDRNSYNITGNLSSGWIEQIGLESAQFNLVSSATVDYDRNQYIYYSSDSKNNPPIQKIETQVEVYPEVDLTKAVIGGVVGGLLLLALITAGLYKAGFFKSQLKQMMQDTSEDGPGADGEAASPE
ncbi:integrin alpha-M-like [Salvelinus fontinalis]|uniref:integrin alpha-M-like n=1 Tax=Salvelinus fontinalis TaxID=8038 RepID=UPI002485DE0E|nr:integrin alpha-M-like [Salvelinus fontinalis]